MEFRGHLLLPTRKVDICQKKGRAEFFLVKAADGLACTVAYLARVLCMGALAPVILGQSITVTAF